MVHTCKGARQWNARAHGSKEPRAFGMEQSMAWSMWGMEQSVGRPGAWQSMGREHSGLQGKKMGRRASDASRGGNVVSSARV